MKTNFKSATAAAAAALLVFSSVPARAWEYSGDASADVQGRQWGGAAGDTHQAKLEEYHPNPSGVFIDHFNFEVSTGSYELIFRSRNIDQLDQEYKLEGGKPGIFTWEASWNQDPHTYAYNARSPYHGSDKNVLVLPNAARGTGAVNAAYTTNITDLVADSPYLTLRNQVNEAKIGGVYRLNKDLTLSFDGLQRSRNGIRKMGGTFGFTNTQELPMPIDTLTHELGARLDYAKKDFQASLAYEISNFHNNAPDLTFDSPLTATASNTQAASTRGRMALEPDNQSQEVTVAIGGNLPAKTHVSAQGSFAFFRQNMALEPYSINPLSFTAGQIAAGTNVVPYLSADRLINVYTGAVVLSNHYFDSFRTSLAARTFQEDSKSTDMVFPGYVRYDTSFSAGYIEPERPQQLKQSVEWKGDYDVTKTVSLAGGYKYESNKVNREVPLSYEQTFQGGVTVRPSTRFFVNANYLVAARRMKTFDPSGYVNTTNNAWLESPGLLRFDVTDRNRNQARVQAQYNTDDDTTYGLSYRITYDNFRPGKASLDGAGYGPTPVQQARQYGLLSNHTQAVGVNAAKSLSAHWDADLYGEYDYTRMELLSNMGSFGGTTFQDFATDWDQQYRAQSIIAGTGVTYKPNAEWKLNGSYDVVSTVGHLDFFGVNQTSNINGVGAGTVQSLPSIKRLTQTVGLRARYQYNKLLAFTARYSFTQYLVQDWQAVNTPLVSKSGAQIYMGANQGDAVLHLIALGADLRF